MECTQGVLGLFSVFAISLRIEYERGNAERAARKGLYTKAIECLQYLIEELGEACGILLSLESNQEDHIETFKYIQRMLESQNIWIRGQLEHVEREASSAVLTPLRGQSSPVEQHQQRQQLSPLPRSKPPTRLRQRPATSIRPVQDNTTTQSAGPDVRGSPPQGAPSKGLSRPPRGPFKRITRLPVPKQQESATGIVKKPLPPTVVVASRRTYKPWPTADADYSRPALKPITFKMDRDMLPRLPGDMSGAVHIRRQLDEQEEAVEQARTNKWLKDLGQQPDNESDKSDDSSPQSQKRRAEDELDSPPGKRTKVHRLRGGNDNDVTVGLRKLLGNLNPFKRRESPGPSSDASANSSSTKNNCFVNDDSGDEGPRNANSKNKDRAGAGASTSPPEELVPEIPPPVIVMESLRSTFGDSEDDRKARRYRDWFASLITLAESTPGSITGSSFWARYGQKKKLEKLKTALGHMSVRPFEKRQATQRRIKLLEAGMKRCGKVAGQLTDMEPAAECLEECYGKIGRDATALENQQSKLASQVALEEKIFVGGVEHGDCFLSWIIKTRNNVYWELSFADRTREKPERIKVGNETYYSV
ncbi:hypothetical protein LY78DRAFT_86556 [Colletotrichum sublineola]|nr:hypothetical protein LY78DRAFT_86556 [Colletotrichum sublineola]